MQTIELDTGKLTRLSYLDLPVPAELLGLTGEQVRGLSWAAPAWVREDQPLLGNAAWIGELGGHRIAIDPLQTLDVVLRPDRDTERAHQDAVARLFAETGFPVESIDLVVMTHIDGVGMAARRSDDGKWAPFFPNARILLSERELAGFLAAGSADEPTDLVGEAWRSLIDQGCIDTYSHQEVIAPGLVTDVSGGHGPGHAVLHFQKDGATRITHIGHLAVTPLHLATGECAPLNEDPAAAWQLLHEYARDGRLLAGSLWPTPGFGRWLDGELRPGL